MTNKLLEFIKKAAQSKTNFSNTTYSIIYNLIKKGKIAIFFTPSLRVKNFFVSDEPVNVVGGYNYEKRKFEVFVKWSAGYDIITQAIQSYMPILCNKIFGVILSDALIVYDYKHQGELSKHDMIKAWYKTYFDGVFGDTLHRPDLAKKLSDVVSANYGARLFDRMEKSIIEGKSPAVKISKKGENVDLDIEGIASIKKGDKELHDIFSDAIEDYVNEYRDQFHIDHTGYADLMKLCDDFGDFGAFLYKNRDLDLNPDNLKEIPEDQSVTNSKSPYFKEGKDAAKKELEKLAEKEENNKFKAYIDSNPKIKAALKKSEDEVWDKRAERFFGKTMEKRQGVLDARRDRLQKQNERQKALKDRKAYINSDNNEDYISAYLLKRKEVSIDDLNDAADGLKKSVEAWQNANKALEKIPQSSSKLMSLVAPGKQAKQVNDLIEHQKISCLDKQFSNLIYSSVVSFCKNNSVVKIIKEKRANLKALC